MFLRPIHVIIHLEILFFLWKNNFHGMCIPHFAHKFIYYFTLGWASLVAQMVKNLSAMQETQVLSWAGKITWKREWLLTPVFCLENSMNRGPWGVTVHGVTNFTLRCFHLLAIGSNATITFAHTLTDFFLHCVQSAGELKGGNY